MGLPFIKWFLVDALDDIMFLCAVQGGEEKCKEKVRKVKEDGCCQERKGKETWNRQ